MTGPFWDELAKAVETVEAYPQTTATIDRDGRYATVYARPAQFETETVIDSESGGGGEIKIETLVAQSCVIVVIAEGTTAVNTAEKVLDEKQIIGFGGKHATDGKKR